MTDKVQKIREEVEKLNVKLLRGACSSQIAMETMCKEEAYNEVLAILDTMQEESVSKKLSNVQRTVKNLKEPVSDDLEEASKEWLKPQLDKYYADYGEVKMMELTHFDGYAMLDAIEFGAKWQKEQDQSTIELAEDHAYFAGRTKTIDEIKKALLSEVLPCFMHGGEADEVVAKLDEVLNQKK